MAVGVDANFLDKLIGYVSPKAGLKRAAAREAIRSFDAGKKGGQLSSWGSRGMNSPQLMTSGTEAYVSRERAREMYFNNGFARSAVRKISNGTTGTGIMPTISKKIVDGKILNIDRDEAVKIYDLFDLWARDVDAVDFNETLDFYGLQKVIVRTMYLSGSCFILKKIAKDKDIPLQIQVLEPDFLDISKGVNGCQMDSNGKVTGYWLFNSDPKTSGLGLKSSLISKKDCIYFYDAERPGQLGGVTWLSTAMIQLRDLSDYQTAELTRKKIASSHSIFIENPEDDNSMFDGDCEIPSKIVPGMITELNPGQTVTIAQPPITQGDDAFAKVNLRAASAGSSISYEALSNDYSNVNFSSGRMGWIENHREIEHIQEIMLIPMVLIKIWGWFNDALILKGKTKNRYVVSWTAPRREMLDPVKETNALVLQIKAGFISPQEACRQLGYNFEENLEEIKKFYELLDESGVKLDTDLRNSIKPLDIIEK